MKPYYEHAGIRIYHGDCREVMASWPECFRVNVIVTDPPYGIGLVTKTSDHQSRFLGRERKRASVLYDDDPGRIADLLSEAIPMALSRAERGLIFPGQAMLRVYPEPAAMGCVYLSNGAGRCAWGFQCMHPILFYGQDPWLQAGKGGRPNSFRADQPNHEQIDHPCPKPLPWMKWAIGRASVAENDTVLDPFMGSGTTLRAAKDLGRKAIGIEIEEKYCEIAAKRLSQEVLDFGRSA